MRHRHDAYNWIVRLDKGEQLHEKLIEFIKAENIKTGWVFGIGLCSSAEIGSYNLETKKFNWKKFDQNLEIINLQGNITINDGEPHLHLHGSFSDNQMNMFGGHVKDLTIGSTCELFVHDWFASGGIARKHDDQTGLNLLDL